VPLLVLCVALGGPVAAQEWGQHVIRQGKVSNDYYAAGGTVRVAAQVDGDVIVAGGIVEVDSEIRGIVLAAGGDVRIQGKTAGDAMAFGGSVEVRGNLGDDARLAGGEVNVYGTVAGDLIVAGGRVMLAPVAKVGGRAVLAGESVTVSGTVERRLLAAGNEVTILGVINGDVEVEASQLVIGPSARISGDVNYRGPAEARIDPAAKISGKVRHMVSPLGRRWAQALVAGRLLGVLVVLFGIFVTGAAWYGLFPSFSLSAAAELGKSPLASIGAGLLVVAGTPVMALGLSVTVIGLPLAALLILLYPAALLLGVVTAVFFVGDSGRLLLDRRGGTGRRLAGLLASSLLLAGIFLIPYLGSLTLLAAAVAGTGAFWLRLARADGGR
jgi:cytoskeletal protein CcmA (bactofilin family)